MDNYHYLDGRMNTTPHQHAAVIKAWADGRPVSWYSPSDNRWNLWEYSFQPQFNTHTKWRIESPLKTHPLIQPPAVPAWLSVWRSTAPTEHETHFLVIRDALKLYDILNDITAATGIVLDQDRVRFHYRNHNNVCIAVGFGEEEVISLNLKLYYDYLVDESLGFKLPD